MFEGFAKLRSSLTMIVFLRRISRELHRANELAEARLALDHPTWYKQSKFHRDERKTSSIPPAPKFRTFEVASVEDWNQKHRDDHPELYDEDED